MAVEHVRAPNPLLWVSDGPRALWELGAYTWSWPTMLAAPVSMDLQPVLVLPGLSTGDATTKPLRATLSRLGYPVHGWKLGVNVGPSAKIVAGIRARLGELYDRYETPVSVIGWSLGGIYARQLAREFPDSVRQVITLGSPIKLHSHSQSNARYAYNLMRRWHSVELGLPLEVDDPPLTMPATSLYSRIDGYVAWQTCRDTPGPLAENIEVVCSHLGFGHSLPAVWAVADRLAQPAGELSPFQPPRLMRAMYPDHS